MEDESDGEEDDPKCVGEEENVVEPSTPEGGGEEEEEVEACQTEDTKGD